MSLTFATPRLTWFTERIGQRVFRTKNGCQCKVCDAVYHEGLIVIDKAHAEYLQEVEGDYQAGGTDCRYFETREERDEYENK